MKIAVAVSTSNLESTVTAMSTAKNMRLSQLFLDRPADRRQKGRQTVSRPGRGDHHQPEGAEIFLLIFLI
jgi:hypothetical protein